MLHTLLAARPVPTTADWWMVGLTAAAAVGTVGALFAVLAANKHARKATGVQLEAQHQELELTRQALEDERRARQEEIARLEAEAQHREAEQRWAEAAQARRVSAGEPEVEHRDQHLVLAVDFAVHNDSAEPIYGVTGQLYGWPSGQPGTGGRTHYASAVPVEVGIVRGHQKGRLRFVSDQGPDVPFTGFAPPAEPVFEVDLEFSDAADRRWLLRQGSPHPVRVDSENPAS